LVFLGVSEFDLWIFGYIFLGHEGDAHAPACMDAKPTSLDRRPPIISRMRHQWNYRDMLRVKHNSPHLRRAANDPSNPSFVCRIAKKIKGSIKEVVGKAAGDAKLEAEGKADKVEGKVQSALGGLKDTLKSTVSTRLRATSQRE
jgi:uncharacterized protein YjbJ (UPF0337 family)